MSDLTIVALCFKPNSLNQGYILKMAKNIVKKILNGIKIIWNFIWKGESIWSFLAFLLFAFIVVKFLVYPTLNLAMATTHPIVAVISGSMDHGIDKNGYLCGSKVNDYQKSLQNYWEVCGLWYEKNGISFSEFETYPFKNGFSKGDVLIIRGISKEKYEIGDVIVFWADQEYPLIHRLINISKDYNTFSTKGDHNYAQLESEKEIDKSKLLGKAIFKIPYLGYIKILIYDLFSSFLGVFR
ncbi:MAG TPA: signal peptidase I [Candidatus Woesearchaeota archaeon]|nr:signal peptidase I [Candidatus Woesearchaeota archaeon]